MNNEYSITISQQIIELLFSDKLSNPIYEYKTIINGQEVNPQECYDNYCLYNNTYYYNVEYQKKIIGIEKIDNFLFPINLITIGLIIISYTIKAFILFLKIERNK